MSLNRFIKIVVDSTVSLGTSLVLALRACRPLPDRGTIADNRGMSHLPAPLGARS